MRLNRRNHPRVIMASPDDRNAGTQVDEAIALDIPDFGISSLVRKHSGLNADTSWRLIFADFEQFFIRCHGLSPKPLSGRLHASI